MSNWTYLNKVRIRTGDYASTKEFGFNGAFLVATKYRRLCVIASDGYGWRHVSVSVPGSKECPTWAEMCEVKAMFWDPEDAVMQLHPPESVYVNQHPGCLHMWQPIGKEIPLPPSWMVGIKTEAAL